MSAASISRVAAVLLFVLAATVAHSNSFRVSKVSWIGDALCVEVKTDLPDGNEVNLCITDDKNGFNCVSDTKSFTVNGGRFLADGFAKDRNDEPFRPGQYWVSIAKGTDILPRVAVLPITVSKHKSTTNVAESKSAVGKENKEPAASPAPIFQVKQSWVQDVFRVEGKANLPDGTWLNLAVQDNDGTLVADEGFICAQVTGGRFIVEGFTKDGTNPIPPGRYKLSIEPQNPLQSGFGFSTEKTITVSKRPSFTKSRLAEVRAINVANYANAKDNAAAATKPGDVSDLQRDESDMQLRHQAANNTIDQLTSSGALRVKCDDGKAWVDPGLWEASDARDKENLARAIYETCSSQSIDIYDSQSAKKLARYGSVLGFRAY
jgi:hypothetical protein